MTPPNAAPSADMSAPLSADTPPTAAPRAHPAPAVRAALGTLRPTLAEVADAIGASSPAIRSYFGGERNTPPEVRQRLAAYLRSQARRLDTLADALASGEVKWGVSTTDLPWGVSPSAPPREEG